MTAGLWLSRCRLVAVLADGATPRPIRAALTDDARWGLVEYLAHCDCALVASEALARTDPLPGHAARRGLTVWLIDDALLDALLRAAAIRSPARAAALLARLPALAALRPFLRPLTSPVPEGRQLQLLPARPGQLK